MAIRRIGIVTDTHYTTQARQDAIGANRWPVWMNGATPWHFGAVEDKAAKVNATFAERGVDAIVHLGDLYTPQGAVADYPDVHPLFTVAGKPTLYCLGNHDVEFNITTKEQYLEAVGQAAMYFYYDVGDVRIFILNTVCKKESAADEYHYVGDASGIGVGMAEGWYLHPEQLAWLDTQLAAADTTGKLSIVCGHHPWHTAPTEGNTSNLKNGPDLLDVCKSHRVIACFNGHQHAPARVTGHNNIDDNEILCVTFEGMIDRYYGEVDEVTYHYAAHAVVEIDDATGYVGVLGFNGERSYALMQYEISSWTDLAQIGVTLPDDGNYLLTKDLATTDDDYAGIGDTWTPLCATNGFSGRFDGNGFTIDGVTINTTVITAGFFKLLAAGCVIPQIRLTNASVTSTASNVGVLAGLVGAGSKDIRNVHLTGSVQGLSAVGGAFGIDGATATGIIQLCTVDVAVTSIRNVGTANNHWTGGFIGRSVATGLTYQNCHSKGDVVGQSTTYGNASRVGGFAGTLEGTGALIETCLATGNVTAGGTYVNAFCGNKSAGATITACYFDTHGGTLSDVNATGLSTAELQHADIVADLITGAGWNFMNIWGKRAGHYPELWTPELWPLARALSEDTFALTVTADLMDYYDDRAAFLKALKAAVIDQWDDAFTSALQAHWDEAIWGADGLNMESPIQSLTVDLGRLASGGPSGMLDGSIY